MSRVKKGVPESLGIKKEGVSRPDSISSENSVEEEKKQDPKKEK